MAKKVKLGKWEVDEEEFEREIAEATRRGEEAMRTEPQAKSASYDYATSRLVLELKNGTTLIVPCRLIQGLRNADPHLIAQVELLPRGAALHWEKLDVDISLAGLLAGSFGTKRWMREIARELGRQGGRVNSAEKAAASCVNGMKGGRPRKAS